MGGYVNSGIIFQLPIRGKGLPVNGQLFFDESDSDEKIIEAFVNSNLTQIQAIKPPTEDEIKILNEVFLKRPDIIEAINLAMRSGEIVELKLEKHEIPTLVKISRKKIIPPRA